MKDLEALGHIPGRRAAAVAIADVMTEYQARFPVTPLHMLDQWSRQQSPITRIQVLGVLVAHDRNGTTIVPEPVDYISWTQRIASFATDSNLPAMKNRVLPNDQSNDADCAPTTVCERLANQADELSFGSDSFDHGRAS